jgi:hypothetical protein
MLRLGLFLSSLISINNCRTRLVYDNCRKLALSATKPSANLHTAEWRLDLSRRTCMITDDNRDTIFVNEVQLKPTSPGMTTGTPPQYRNNDRFRILTLCRLPLRACLYVIMVTLSYLWGGSGYIVWHELDPVLLYITQVPRNQTVQIFDTISNNNVVN